MFVHKHAPLVILMTLLAFSMTLSQWLGLQRLAWDRELLQAGAELDTGIRGTSAFDQRRVVVGHAKLAGVRGFIRSFAWCLRAGGNPDVVESAGSAAKRYAAGAGAGQVMAGAGQCGVRGYGVADWGAHPGGSPSVGGCRRYGHRLCHALSVVRQSCRFCLKESTKWVP